MFLFKCSLSEVPDGKGLSISRIKGMLAERAIEENIQLQKNKAKT
jgi:hypothetical protein